MESSELLTCPTELQSKAYELPGVKLPNTQQEILCNLRSPRSTAESGKG